MYSLAAATAIEVHFTVKDLFDHLAVMIMAMAAATSQTTGSRRQAMCDGAGWNKEHMRDMLRVAYRGRQSDVEHV